MRAAIYVRVSSDEQVLGHSLDGQRARLEAWAEREGWTVVERFADEGISAKDLNRPGLQAALEAARVGAIDLLLVSSRTRYARDVGDAANTDKELARFGVAVMSLDEPGTNGDSPAAFLYRGMTDVMSAHERLQLGKRLRDGWRAKAAKGLHVGDVPFGYRADGDRRSEPMVVDAAEAEGVRWAYETYATGSVGQAEVAEGLEARGYVPHSKRGRTSWSWTTVRKMLANRVYLGELWYRGAWYAGRHEAIVTPDLFDRVRAVTAARRRSPKSYSRSAAQVYMLSGIGGCARCRANLWADGGTPGNGRKYRYYRCSSRHGRVRACADARRGIRAELPESLVERAILATVERLDGLDELVREEAARLQPPDVDAERERLERRIARASRLMLAGGDEALALGEIATARRGLAALSARPRSVGASATLCRVGELWPRMEASERRDAARLVFERVLVDLAGESVLLSPRAEYEAAYLAGSRTGSGIVVLAPPEGFEGVNPTSESGALWLRVAS